MLVYLRLIILNIKPPIFIVIFSILTSYLFDYFTRIPDSYNIVRNIFGYYTSRADHRVISDMHTGINDDISTKPYVIPYSHPDSVFIAGISRFRMDWMASRIN